MKVSKKELVKEVIFAICAGFLGAIAIKVFTEAGNMIPAGFSGMALFIVRAFSKYFNTTISYGILYILLNIPACLLVYKTISKRFAIISLIEVGCASLFVEILPSLPITDDMLLIAVFGGIIGGASNSLIVMANACSGGMDFLTIYFAKKKHKSIWTQAFLVNACVLIGYGLCFGWKSALYSIIYQYVVTQVLNTFDKRYKRCTFMVISSAYEKINEEILKQFHHSATILDGYGAFTNEPKKLIYCIVGDYEKNQFAEMILKIDSKAFISISPTNQIIGNFHEMPY